MRLIIGAIALVLAPASHGWAQGAPTPPSADELIARHLAARGGAAALAAIKTVTMTGEMRPGGFDVQLAYREIMSRPGRVRIEATLQGLTVVQAWDGHSGWQIQPFQGRKDPESVSADDAKSLAEEADFEGALIDYRAKGATVRSLGSEDIDGAPAWALQVSLANGDVQTFYLDPDVWLTVRLVTRQKVRGAESFTQTDFSDYEKVNGVYFPFEVASGPKGSDQKQRVTYKTIAANAPVGASPFVRPSGPPVASSPSAPAPETPVPPAKKPPAVKPPAVE